MNLSELAIKHRSDKTPEIGHSYTPFYEELFRGRKVNKLLEIGIGYTALMTHVENYKVGASLYVWRDHFKDAQIYGIDINPESKVVSDRITTMTCDQSSPDDLNQMIDRWGGDWDIIIDDGSHKTEHQIISAKTLMPHLKEDGVYVIEDVKEPFKLWEALKEYKFKEHYFGKSIDDRLVVLTK